MHPAALPVDMISKDVELSQLSSQTDNSGTGDVGTAVRHSPPALRAEVVINDDGGHRSSADQLALREAKDVLGLLRRSFPA